MFKDTLCQYLLNPSDRETKGRMIQALFKSHPLCTVGYEVVDNLHIKKDLYVMVYANFNLKDLKLTAVDLTKILTLRHQLKVIIQEASPANKPLINIGYEAICVLTMQVDSILKRERIQVEASDILRLAKYLQKKGNVHIEVFSHLVSEHGKFMHSQPGVYQRASEYYLKTQHGINASFITSCLYFMNTLETAAQKKHWLGKLWLRMSYWLQGIHEYFLHPQYIQANLHMVIDNLIKIYPHESWSSN